MNERVPDSSRLPLRAMVMVLLFLGVIFLLLGWQAIGSSGNSDNGASPASTVTTTTTTVPTSASGNPPAPAQAEVRVFNISMTEGVAARTADQLKAAGFKVVEVGNLTLSGVSATTVYYSDAAGERATAEAVGQKLGASVEPRVPAIADQPPGVVVVVTG